MGKTKPPYPPEFRVRRCAWRARSGRPLAEIAGDLGCLATRRLRHWVRQTKVDAGRGPGPDQRGARGAAAPAPREPRAARGARDPQEGRGFLRPGDRSAEMNYRLIDAEKPHHAVSRLARVLGVSRAGFYAWSTVRPRRARAADAALTDAHRARSTRDRRHLRRAAHPRRARRRAWHPRRSQARRSPDARGRHRRRLAAPLSRAAPRPRAARPRQRPTSSSATSPPTRPDELWFADITYVPTWQGWLYLAAVVDAFSRCCVGWSMRDDLQADLVSTPSAWP